MSFEKVPLIGSTHSDETRNIINLMAQIINNRGVEILSDSAFLTWLEENGIKHREEVATVADLPVDDSLNTVRGVVADNKIYIKKESGWVPFQTIDISKINEVETKAINRIEELAITPMKFGAVGDGVADDTAALQQANDYTANNNLLLNLLDKTYRITDTVYFDCNMDGSRARIEYDGVEENTAIFLGKENGVDVAKLEITFPNLVNKNISWSDKSIGIELCNIRESKVLLTNSGNFGVGYLFTGRGRGNAYNEYSILSATNNKINVQINPMTGGWVNENNFFGGRYSHLSTNGVNVLGTKHFHITSTGDHPPNNNVFYKPSVEGDVAEYVIDDDCGQYNTFISPRFEGSGRKVRFGHKSSTLYSHSNVIFYGYQTQSLIVEESQYAKYNAVYNRQEIKMNGNISAHNVAGGEGGIFTAFDAQTSPLTANTNEFVVKVSQLGVHMKTKNDEEDKLFFSTQGRIHFRGADGEASKYFQNWGNNLRLVNGNFMLAGGGWNNEHIMLGGYHLWIDGTGNLRLKSSTPTSDTDGKKILTE